MLCSADDGDDAAPEVGAAEDGLGDDSTGDVGAEEAGEEPTPEDGLDPGGAGEEAAEEACNEEAGWDCSAEVDATGVGAGEGGAEDPGREGPVAGVLGDGVLDDKDSGDVAAGVGVLIGVGLLRTGVEALVAGLLSVDGGVVLDVEPGAPLVGSGLTWLGWLTGLFVSDVALLWLASDALVVSVEACKDPDIDREVADDTPDEGTDELVDTVD